MNFYFFFFFQAEDGIRDVAMTGVQTCALPIYRRLAGREIADGPVADPGRSQTREGRLSAAELTPGLSDVGAILVGGRTDLGGLADDPAVPLEESLLLLDPAKRDRELQTAGDSRRQLDAFEKGAALLVGIGFAAAEHPASPPARHGRVGRLGGDGCR